MEKEKPKYKRLFIGINLAEIEDVGSLIRNLKSNLKAEKIHWAQEKNLHLTIKFIGKTEIGEIDNISSTIEKSCFGIAPFTLHFGPIGIFGSKYAPRVIWLGGNSNGIIEKIEKKISDYLVEYGIESDRQNFVSHITIAKIHQPLKSKKYFQKVLDSFGNFRSAELLVKDIILFSSKLTPDGPIYKIEKVINLK